MSTSREKGKVYTNCIEGGKFEMVLHNTCLGLLFFSNAEKYKDNICQISATEDRTETYNNVKLRTIRLALELEKKGVTYKDVIGICSDNTMDNVIPIISAMYIGAKVVNIDHTLNSRQIKQLLSLVTPAVIFVEETTYHLMKDTLRETSYKSEIILLGTLKPYRDEKTYTPSKVDVHETAILFFSSGSTSAPKAACHSHYSLLRIVQTIWNSDLFSKNILHFTTYCWITFILITICSFLNGATRIFCREPKDGSKIIKYIEEYKISSLFMAPMYSSILTNTPIKKNISSLEYIILSGSVISGRQLKTLTDRFSDANVIFNYGLTEVGLVTTFNPRTDAHLIKTKIGSCGKVAPEAKIKIVDIDTDEALTHDNKGEIRIKSPGLMKGYHSLDCAEFFDSEGFLRSGDIGYYDADNCFYVLDKLKELFKYKDILIIPFYIEEVLLEHPSVKDAGVFGLPSRDEGDIPAACVVLHESSFVTEDEILKFVADRVTDENILRGGVKFVKALPKTMSGRCVRRDLKNLFLETKKESDVDLLAEAVL